MEGSLGDAHPSPQGTRSTRGLGALLQVQVVGRETSVIHSKQGGGWEQGACSGKLILREINYNGGVILGQYSPPPDKPQTQTTAKSTLAEAEVGLLCGQCE